MSEELTISSDVPAEVGSRLLSTDELIRIEIDGKSGAVARYDAILWKVRSGYVVVIYGAITFASKWLTSDNRGIAASALLPAIVFGFSLAGFAIDATFQRSKFRVIAARNELVATSWHLARSNFSAEHLTANEPRILTLLEMSGEKQDPETVERVKRYLWSRDTASVFLPLYAAPVVVAIVVAVTTA